MTTRRIALSLCIIALLSGLPASPAEAAVAPPPRAGGYFATLAPGAALPSETTCAGRVHRSTWEPRPENTVANNKVPASVSLPGFTPDDGGTDQRARALANRVTGNFKGTTDEIFQWAACKWGFADDRVRAQAVVESTWYQSALGDISDAQRDCQVGYTAPCPRSFGILQVKAPVWQGTFPSSRDATAFNVDYALMVRRVCFEGWMDWLYEYPGSNVTYRAGDEWGCIGFWYSGTWYGDDTQVYINAVKQKFTAKPWRSWPDQSASVTATASAITLSSPTSVPRGTAFKVSWSAAAGSTAPKDWISLYRAADPNTAFGEWYYTGGTTSGSVTFTAPSTAGTYEIRYLVNDGFTSVAEKTISVT